MISELTSFYRTHIDGITASVTDQAVSTGGIGWRGGNQREAVLGARRRGTVETAMAMAMAVATHLAIAIAYVPCPFRRWARLVVCPKKPRVASGSGNWH